MRAYVVRRVLQFIPVLFLASVAVWSILHFLPGSPAVLLAGDNPTADEIARIEARLGLDRPVWAQYLTWVGNALHGDLGDSLLTGFPVASMLGARIPATVQLAVMAMGLLLAISFPLGIVVALRPTSWVARGVSWFLALTLAAPGFWIGFLLLLLFAVHLGWLPALSDYVPFGKDPWRAFRNTILPALAIGLNASAITARFVSSSLTDTLDRDFVRTARAKGAPEHVVTVRHALRNSMLPTMTVVGLQLAALLTGSIVTEVIFTYPGVGRLLYAAISGRDYAVLQGALLFVVVVFLVLNLVVDVLYAYLDPRIRYR